jgi:hypothetical protein
MINKLTCLVTALLLSFSSCDLNDDDQNGDFSLYFRATIDGVAWVADPVHVGASLNTSGVNPLIRIHGDGISGTNEYFILEFPPLSANTTDTTITSTGMAGIMEFHRNSQTWTSVSGNLTVHQAGAPIQRQYSGTFSGSFFNPSDNTTITITNGEYMAQGIF